MRLRTTDPVHADSLVRFFQARDYLAVKRSREIVEVVPLVALSETADRRRVIRLLAEWQRENPDAPVQLVHEER